MAGEILFQRIGGSNRGSLTLACQEMAFLKGWNSSRDPESSVFQKQLEVVDPAYIQSCFMKGFKSDNRTLNYQSRRTLVRHATLRMLYSQLTIHWYLLKPLHSGLAGISEWTSTATQCRAVAVIQMGGDQHMSQCCHLRDVPTWDLVPLAISYLPPLIWATQRTPATLHLPLLVDN